MDTCDRCGKSTAELTTVEIWPASFWSPGENELWCSACLNEDEREAQRLEAARDERADRRRDERDGF